MASTSKIRGEPGIDTELHMFGCYHKPALSISSDPYPLEVIMIRKMKTEAIYKTSREPKTLELEKTDDARYRLVITVKKLGALTAVEYFLDPDEAHQLSEALKM